MQKFVCQPNLDGKFEIAKWDEIEKQYVPIPNEVYSCEKEAEDWARKLNKEYKEELQQEKEKQKKIRDCSKKYLEITLKTRAIECPWKESL